MLTYKLDHRNFRFDAKKRGPSSLIIKRAATASLLAKLEGAPLAPIGQSPQFQLLAGTPSAFFRYLNGPGKSGAAKSAAAFDQLLNSDSGYASGQHAGELILCEQRGAELVILDGVHRAAALLAAGVESIPIAVRAAPERAAPSQLEQYLFDYKDDFLEWYTPIEIGGHTIHERTFPNFVERPEYLTNKERGQSKFDYLIRKNLPKLEGKSVCDVGCSIGLFAYNLLKLGAKSVDGFDRSDDILQPTNTRLPRQSVVQQALFVKNLLQLQDGKRYDQLDFHERDIAKLDFKTFRYDVFFSCCVLYHFGPLFETIIRDISQTSHEVFLQANLGHSGALAEFASVAYHRALLEKYGYRVTVDAPDGYLYPVIKGSK